jgi:hypothetical protein
MKKPQSDKILSHLKRGRTLTTLQAMRDFGCCRLAARIADLKAAGHKISAYWAKQGSQRVYRYYLAK